MGILSLMASAELFAALLTFSPMGFVSSFTFSVISFAFVLICPAVSAAPFCNLSAVSESFDPISCAPPRICPASDSAAGRILSSKRNLPGYLDLPASERLSLFHATLV